MMSIKEYSNSEMVVEIIGEFRASDKPTIIPIVDCENGQKAIGEKK